MYIFPKNLYTDVRIEETISSEITYENASLRQNLKRKSKGAFIRVFDGVRWYYGSSTDIDNIQEEINKLASMAKENESIEDHPIVKKFQVNTGEYLSFKEHDILEITQQEKLNLLKSYFPILSSKEEIKIWRGIYIDKKVIKEFYSSKGANLKHDYQTCAIVLRYSMNIDGKSLDNGYDKVATKFNDLFNLAEEMEKDIEIDKEYVKNANPVVPGKYTVVFSPIATGVFTHESFGHKSEADFMVGDETMMKEWTLGKKVASDILSIVDTGSEQGSGFTLFDDEGTKATKTYLIKDGILSGRLHSSITAESLSEETTGNARAMNFEYEPIVRMTSTYIEAGKQTKDELISEIKEGIYIRDVKHGSGMSNFTIAPNTAYMIRDGKLAEPVNIAVVIGNVMETLHEIDGVSKELEILSFALGGCGKMEQFPLAVGLGGPYIRVNNITVQ